MEDLEILFEMLHKYMDGAHKAGRMEALRELEEESEQENFMREWAGFTPDEIQTQTSIPIEQIYMLLGIQQPMILEEPSLEKQMEKAGLEMTKLLELRRGYMYYIVKQGEAFRGKKAHEDITMIGLKKHLEGLQGAVPVVQD